MVGGQRYASLDCFYRRALITCQDAERKEEGDAERQLNHSQ